MPRTLPPWIAIALLALVPTLWPQPATAASRHYERWVRPAPLKPLERQAWRAVRKWARQRGLTLRYDARLARAARSQLNHVEPDPEEARRQAHRWGWTDGQLAAVLVRTVAQGSPAAAIEQELDALDGIELNRAGLAISRTDGKRTIAILLSHRLVSLVPTVHRTPDGRLTLAGSLTGGQRGELTVVVTQPGDRTERSAVAVSRGRFATDLDLGRRRGVAAVQLLLDRGRGPEIAANFPVGVNAAPWRNGTDPEVGAVHEHSDAVAALTAAIFEIRASQGLPLPAQSASLSTTAASHAADMRDHGFFAHVSPSTGDVTQRLQSRGIRYARALENIAAAADPEAIIRAWMSSPSHRANLLDAGINILGVGVARSTDRLYAVAVLMREPDEGGSQQLAVMAHKQLNVRRHQLGLRDLPTDRELSRLAEQHSREIAGVGRADATNPFRGNLVDTVFRELDVSEAAADVFVAESVDVVARSAHLAERFDRAGVGVFRHPGKSGPQLWVTVIYARR